MHSLLNYTWIYATTYNRLSVVSHGDARAGLSSLPDSITQQSCQMFFQTYTHPKLLMIIHSLNVCGSSFIFFGWCKCAMQLIDCADMAGASQLIT